MATKQFQNAKLKVDHLDLSSDTARSALQSGENISHSLGKIARWYKDIVWSDTKATIDAYGIVKLSDDYESTSTDTVPTSKTLNDVVQLMKQTGGWNTTYDFNLNIDSDENLQNGQFKVTEHDIEGDIDHYVTIKGLGSAAFTDSDEYATAGHTHLYAGSSTAGGVANSAAKLSDIPAGGIGSETKPVYFSGTTGRPVACTYSLNASVPSGAVFTDEKVKQSPVTTDGSFEVLFAGSTGNTEKTEGVGKTTTLVFNPSKGALTATSFSGKGSGLTSLNASKISSGTLAVARLADSGVVAGTYGPAANASLTHAGTFDVPDFTVDAKGRVTGAHTRTFTLPTQYVHPTHTAYDKGLYKITVDALGHITSATAVVKDDITALGIPAQDTVYKHPTYETKSSGLYKITVDGLGHVSATASVTASDLPSHTHTKSQITDFPTSLKNPNSLTVQGNGTTSFTYDGSAAKTLNIKSGTGISVSSDTSGNITITNTSTNTDTKVTQSVTNAAHYRPIVFGKTHTETVEDLAATITDQVYVSTKFYACPNTGTIYAPTFSGALSGNADTATALTSSAGSATQPVYFSSGKPVVCTYTLGKSVPSNAVFTDTKVTQTNTTTAADYRVILSANANDTTETTTARKSTNFLANPSTGEFYAKGYRRIDITGNTVDINTYNLSSGSPMRMFFIEKTNGGAANITNIPVANVPFLLDVELIRWASATDYITRQIYTNAANPDNSYVRYCTSGTWESWTKRVYTDTHYTSHLITGASATATANAAATNGNVYLNILDNTTVRNSHNIVGSGATTVTSDANGKITISSTNTVYTHPTYTARTGKPTANATPAFGGTFTVSQITSDDTGHVTGATDRTITIPNTTMGAATADTAGTIGLVPAPGAGKQTSFLRGDGTWVIPTNTDTKVKQTATTTSAAYEVLFSGTADNRTRTEGARKNSNLTFNPSSGTLTATKFSGSGESLTSLNASNLSSGTLSVDRLATSGATAGSYGPSANATPGYGATFNVPYITVDAKGRVTSISNKTVKIPASDNTNTTYTLSGAYGSGSNTWVTTLTPSSGSATTSTVPVGTTSAYGLMKLYNGVDSTSTALAATANAVKTAYDYKHYIGSTSTDGTATAWSYLAIKEYDNAYPDGMTLKKYGYGGVITLSGGHSRLELYANHNSSTTAYNSNGIQFRTGWADDKKPWRMLLDNVNYSSYITPAEIGASASDHSHPYLPLDGGTMTGNITFAGVSSTEYPALSNQIYFSGSTDWARILYEVTASDAGQLVFETGDDANAKIVFRNKVTSGGTYTRQVTIADGVISGNGSGLTSLNASNISSGTLSADRLATSGVTAGSYGPSANASPAHSGTFNVPYITVDNKGRVMAIATRTITLPASGNTDANVKQSATSTANFRGVILGTNNTVNTGDNRETTVTGQGYITNKIFAQPSTGNLYASNIYAFTNGTDEVRIALYRSGNSSWRFVNHEGTLSLQNNYYNSAVQSWYNVAQFDYSGTNAIKFTTPPQRTGTNRSTTYGYGGISMAICSKNSWAMGMSWLNNARDTIRGEFGAYGTADKLTYYYWGTAHNATKLRLYPDTGGGLVSQQSNGFRIAAHGYGVIFRVDSDNFYILLTDKKTDGSELTGDNWNSKRPLQIGLSSGVCNINGTASTAKKLKYCTLCNEASDAATYPWYRIAYVYTTGTYVDLNLVMMVTCGYGSKWGIFKARARTEGKAGTFGGTVTIEWIVNHGFTNAQLYLLTKNNYQVDTAKSGTATAEIWFKSDGRYWGYTFTVLHEGWRTGTASDLWALSSYSKNGSESYNKNASGIKGATSKSLKTATTTSNTGWTNNATDDNIIPTMSFMAYWNGRYNSSNSNLQYCDRGRFGTIITAGSGDYVKKSKVLWTGTVATTSRGEKSYTLANKATGYNIIKILYTSTTMTGGAAGCLEINGTKTNVSQPVVVGATATTTMIFYFKISSNGSTITVGSGNDVITITGIYGLII